MTQPDLPAETKSWVGLVRKLGAALVVAVIMIGALVISVISEVRSNETAQCVNTVLALRNATSQADAQAHVDFVTALNRAFDAAPGAAQQAAFAEFEVVSKRTAATLKADQDERNAHPLGRC